MAFWDASAIVPLCCSQRAIVQGRRLHRELKRMVVWWGTPLEAADAAQLAAALVWCRESPRQRALVCFDERLRAAAAAVGFSVRP
jgi:hypothetical protein